MIVMMIMTIIYMCMLRWSLYFEPFGIDPSSQVGLTLSSSHFGLPWDRVQGGPGKNFVFDFWPRVWKEGPNGLEAYCQMVELTIAGPTLQFNAI